VPAPLLPGNGGAYHALRERRHGLFCARLGFRGGGRRREAGAARNAARKGWRAAATAKLLIWYCASECLSRGSRLPTRCALRTFTAFHNSARVHLYLLRTTAWRLLPGDVSQPLARRR